MNKPHCDYCDKDINIKIHIAIKDCRIENPTDRRNEWGNVAYRILERTIEKRVDNIANNIFIKAMASSIGRIGYSFWGRYKNTKKPVDLKQAIDLTDIAYQQFAINLDESDKKNLELICKIKNNLAYYWAEHWLLGKADSNQQTLALTYAEDIYKLKGKVSLVVAEQFIDTYNFVQEVAAETKTSSKTKNKKAPKK